MAQEIIILDFSADAEVFLRWAKDMDRSTIPNYDAFWWDKSMQVESDIPGISFDIRDVTSVVLYPTRCSDPHAPTAKLQFFRDLFKARGVIENLNRLNFNVYAADVAMGTKEITGENPFV